MLFNKAKGLLLIHFVEWVEFPTDDGFCLDAREPRRRRRMRCRTTRKSTTMAMMAEKEKKGRTCTIPHRFGLLSLWNVLCILFSYYTLE
jgi:hypothetical protein